jgi:glucosylceramidase
MSYFRNGSRTYNSWVIMIDYDGLPNNGPFKTKSTCIQPRKDGTGVDYHFEYYSYGQFMKFVKRDAVRIDSSEGDKLLGNVAFRNPDGELVLVTVNRQPQAVRFAVQCEKKSFRAEMGPKSVATYVWR